MVPEERDSPSHEGKIEKKQWVNNPIRPVDSVRLSAARIELPATGKPAGLPITDGFDFLSVLCGSGEWQRAGERNKNLLYIRLYYFVRSNKL